MVRTGPKIISKANPIIIREPVLDIYDVFKQHELHTGFCGIAGILLQRKNDDLKAIAYFSCLCNDAVRKYYAYELEV